MERFIYVVGEEARDRLVNSGAEGRGKIIIRGGFSYDRARDRTVN